MSKLALYNVVSLTVYFILAFIVITSWVENTHPKTLFLGVFACWLMLMVGIQIVHFRFKEGQFVNRFMMATTFQILAFLSLTAYFIYSKVADPKALLLSLVFAHMGALAIQSAFFLRLGKSTF